jgi:N-acetylmuramoyl-L-alanine amidase
VVCTPSAALADVDHFVDFFMTEDARVGVVARKRNTPFRRAYFLSADGLADVGDREFPLGDVLEYDGTQARMGLHGRYWTTAETTPNDAITLFKMKRVGDQYVAIAADFQTNKTLAELRDGAWHLVAPPGWAPPSQAGEPLEIWLRSRSGMLHQAIYFGPLAPTRVVLWIHGGPRENVSPRFNPYFHWLNGQGFGVLALNYPGSTGRGARYESQFESAAIADALQAALDYLWAHHVEKVVSWSISAGHNVQLALLAHRFGVSGVIDQAGGDPGEVKAQATRQHIPSLSIVGINDRGGGDAAVDVSYPGGHDITFEPDFRMVLERVGSFLRAAPRWRYRAPPSLHGALVLDPAHTGNARDPNRSHGLAESALTFQLAHTLMSDCLVGRPVVLTRTGDPTLEDGPAASVRERATLLDVNPEAKLLSLHFNASSAKEKSDNLTSAFVPSDHQEAETHLAGELVGALQGMGIGPKLTYAELANVPLERLAPGVFARDLYLLHRFARRRVHVRPAPPRVVFEVAYYDDDAENQRLQERSLSADGTWVLPRIEEMAKAMCPAVLHFFDDARAR